MGENSNEQVTGIKTLSKEAAAIAEIMDKLIIIGIKVYSFEYQNSNLTDWQGNPLNSSIKENINFKTIENLYTPDIRVVSKIPHGCVDMRKVMSKPFCIENLYYAKHEPVDEATLDEFNQNTGNDVKKAEVYLSRKALNEVNSFVLAFAVAEKIIMMRGQHKPETEEGRKLLAHELTHVAQNQNKEFVDHRTREELEEEAVANERTAESIQDPLVTRKVEGKDVVLPASMWHEVSQKLFRELRRWIHYEKFIRPPKEYELLVKKYEYFMKYMSRKYRW